MNYPAIPVTIHIEIDADKMANALNRVFTSDEFKLALHNTFAKECEPYVPMDTGKLAQTVNVTPEYVEYDREYAHYMYMGQVYGPNYPLYKDGVIVGWRSPPGKGPKHPTGRLIQYSTETHPLAASKWDEVMMRDRGDEFKQQVKNLIAEYSRRLI